MRASAAAALMVQAVFLLLATGSADNALSRESRAVGTRQLLNILLVGPAAKQRIGSDEACSEASNAKTVRDDVIYFLAKLAKSGSVTSACRKAEASLSCQLVIGQNTGQDAGVWTRTYELSLNPTNYALIGKVGCFTIP
jgi:hypothetical protein